ncbi:MAG: hypothetical protein HYU64_09120 [Armatimonadetes bacterium]|nr:hypothetical protein [Armatimonadota bacterium]
MSAPRLVLVFLIFFLWLCPPILAQDNPIMYVPSTGPYKANVGISYFPTAFSWSGTNVPNITMSTWMLWGEAKLWPKVSAILTYMNGRGSGDGTTLVLRDTELGLKVPLNVSRIIEARGRPGGFPSESPVYGKVVWRSSQFSIDMAGAVSDFDYSGWGIGLGLDAMQDRIWSPYASVTYFPEFIRHNVSNPAPNTLYYRPVWDYVAGLQYRMKENSAIHFAYRSHTGIGQGNTWIFNGLEVGISRKF